ncbi:MAG: hypothetical protein KAI24_07610 [Planctomycetes bacterium]|nr:hypothetical protein [Planctomycetota bacterium]
MHKKSAIVAIASALLSLLLHGCNTLPAGRKYTLAKVDRDWSLVEPHRLLEQRTDDLLDEVNPTGNWGLTMNGGFLPFLEAIERPEVVIFVSVRIREPDEPEHTLLWEHVYLDSEDKSEHIALNKNSFLPRDDIQLLPPIVYEGQDIFVQIRVIELDQEDNKRTEQLVNTAASAAAAFEPDLGVTASVFQTALSYLVQNNSDDIEFQYDFALSETPGPIQYGGVQYDNVLNPRVGKYVVIKTEHRQRKKAPDGTLDAIGSGIRYGAGEALKFATLGVANWVGGWFCSSNENEDAGTWDFYQWLFAYPFRIDKNSWVAPVWDGGRLACGHGEKRLMVAGNRVVTGRSGHENELFEQQGYLVFSLVASNNGVDVAALSELADQKRLVENLAINTSQLNADDAVAHLQLMTKALTNYAQERAIRKEYLAAMAKAKTAEDIAAVEQDYSEKVEQLKTRDEEQKRSLHRWLEARAELRRRTTGNPALTVGTLARPGRLAGRIVTERLEPEQPGAPRAVRVSYLLGDKDDPDGSKVEFRLWPAGTTQASSVKPLTRPEVTPSPVGPFMAITVTAPTPAEARAYELLVVGLDEDGVRNGRAPIWVTSDPVLEELRVETSDGGAFVGTKWPAGVRAFVHGQNFEYVRAVKVTSGSSTRRLPLQRYQRHGADGATTTQYWIEHDIDDGLDVDRVELVMIDEHFFRDLSGTDAIMLPKCPSNGGLWQADDPLVHAEAWPKDTDRTVKGEGIGLIAAVQLELLDEQDRVSIVEAPLRAGGSVRHQVAGKQRLLRATLIPKRSHGRFSGRRELVHDARQPHLQTATIDEQPLTNTIAAGSVVKLAGVGVEHIRSVTLLRGKEEAMTFRVTDAQLTVAAELTEVTGLRADVTPTITAAKVGGAAIVGQTVPAGAKVVLEGHSLRAGDEVRVRFGGNQTSMLVLAADGDRLIVTADRAWQDVGSITAQGTEPWRDAFIDPRRLRLEVKQ